MSKRKKPLVVQYDAGINQMPTTILNSKYIPCILPNWDNSARSGVKSLVLHNSSPELFKHYLNDSVQEYIKHPQNPPFFIIKSWDEWAEGNYLEPDRFFGRKWLEVIKEVRETNKV